MSTLSAADLSSYRGFQFGVSLAAAAKHAGMSPSAAKLAHRRPALIQELDWRPADATHTDPVQDAVLSFYNGELFRIVIAYDRYKVEGLTEEDMIESLSKAYGAATRPRVEIAYHSNYGEFSPVLARWEDSQYSYNLIPVGNRSSFGVILYSKRLDAQAQAAIAESVRLDELEAPQRALDLQKNRDQAEQLKLEKTRSVNLPNFRP